MLCSVSYILYIQCLLFMNAYPTSYCSDYIGDKCSYFLYAWNMYFWPNSNNSAEYKILCWQFFFLCTLKILFHCLWQLLCLYGNSCQYKCSFPLFSSLMFYSFRCVKIRIYCPACYSSLLLIKSHLSSNILYYVLHSLGIL
jgi:hypothetical protein